jgi:enoyl-CoA hydratase
MKDKSMAQVFSRRDGAVATVVISNPAKYNAMNPEMWQSLSEILDSLERDPEVYAIVLEGDGPKAFVSGADISRFGDGGPAAKNENEAEAEMPYMAPMRCTKPVIAKIRGICMGGGLGLAAACDVRICSDDAVFRMPAGRLGLGYAYEGINRYVELIGPANTLDIFFSARKFDSAEALRMGFVMRVVPAAQLDAQVAEYCALIADNAPLTLRAAKQAVVTSLKGGEAGHRAKLQAMIAQCAASADFKEGKAAFMEKRKAVFKGA